MSTTDLSRLQAAKRVALKRRTRSNMRRRVMWRERALSEMIKLAQWPVGKPAREMREAAVHKAVNRVRHWYPGMRGVRVLAALNRQAVAAYNQAADMGSASISNDERPTLSLTAAPGCVGGPRNA